MNDRDLLNQYLADRDEQAFAELVRRHVDMVYAAARRQVRDPSAAQDVTQHVFVSLAQKGGTIRDREAMAGWLLTSTRFAALDWLRAESRRRHHEAEAAAMKQELFGDSSDAAVEWEAIQPVLDEAMSQLRPRDRDALALRYFRNLSLSDVARELGISTDAAHKRIERATDRLRKQFARRGVTTTGQMLSGALVAHAVTSAPAELVGHITAEAVSAGVAAAAGASLTTTKGAVLLMAATKTQVGIAAVVVIALAAVTVPVVYVSTRDKPAPAPVVAEGTLPATPAPGTLNFFVPTTAPNPQARLNEVYGLSPAQNVRRIAPPFIPEREVVVHELIKEFPSMPQPQCAVFVEIDQSVSIRSTRLGNMSLGNAMQELLDIWPQDTDIPRSMLVSPVPGDWVFREGSMPQQRMVDFCAAVSDVVGSGMMLRSEPMDREVILVRGAIDFERTRTPPGQGVGNRITFATDGPANRKMGTAAQTPREMLQELGRMMARPVLIEAEVDQEKQPFFIQSYQTSDFSNSIDPPSVEAVDPILARVAEQTGLQLKRERRVVPTWRLAPAGL